MISEVKERLKELLDKEGLAILQAPERVKGWLTYACPETQQQHVLLAALEEGIPQAITQLQDIEGLYDDFASRRSLSAGEARWAVEVWRDALKGKLADGSFDLFCRDEEAAESRPPIDVADRPKPPPLPGSLGRAPQISWLERPETWVVLGAVVAFVGLVLLLATTTNRALGTVLLAIGGCGLAAAWVETEKTPTSGG